MGCEQPARECGADGNSNPCSRCSRIYRAQLRMAQLRHTLFFGYLLAGPWGALAAWYAIVEAAEVLAIPFGAVRLLLARQAERVRLARDPEGPWRSQRRRGGWRRCSCALWHQTGRRGGSCGSQDVAPRIECRRLQSRRRREQEHPKYPRKHLSCAPTLAQSNSGVCTLQTLQGAQPAQHPQ